VNLNDDDPLKPSDDQKLSAAKPKQKPKKSPKNQIWMFKVLVMTLFLAIFFSIISEVIVSRSSVAIAYILIFLLVGVNILFDIIGTSAASCNIETFLSMASRKLRGAKLAVYFAKNASRVSSICCDVIGDICGIVSGAAGSSIIIKQLIEGERNEILVYSILLSSLIAAITVSGKALGKSYAIKNSDNIILKVSRILSVFKKNKT
jgi:hypothetical protein